MCLIKVGDLKNINYKGEDFILLDDLAEYICNE